MGRAHCLLRPGGRHRASVLASTSVWFAILRLWRGITNVLPTLSTRLRRRSGSSGSPSFGIYSSIRLGPDGRDDLRAIDWHTADKSSRATRRHDWYNSNDADLTRHAGAGPVQAIPRSRDFPNLDHGLSMIA